MNFYKILISLLFLLPNLLSAKPQVFLDYKIYYTPDNLPYLETLLQFSSPTLKFTFNSKGNLESSVEITQIFKLKDSVVLIDKYIVNSPEMIDSTIEDYFDIRRYQLNEGEYTYEIIVKDLKTNEIVSGEQKVVIKALNSKKVEFSSVEFIQSASKSIEQNYFVKNGYFILPYLVNYYPPELTKIATYMEVYNSESILGENEKFMLTIEVEDANTDNKLENFFKVKKYNTAKIVPIISFLDINELPSGDYNLIISLIDKNNLTFKSETIFFQRRSDMVTENNVSLENLDISKSFTQSMSNDSIPYFLNSLLPICPKYEYETVLAILKKNDTTEMKKYFHSFWVQTDPIKPYDAWLNYRIQVEYCERIFGTQIKHGFETDRGRVYLKYGTPNELTDKPLEPSSYPYQIWHYYRIGKRSNVRFVFYNPDLVTNDYPMLHSDMLGELQNSRWQQDLHKRDTPNTNIDESRDNKHYGGNSGRYYNN